MLRSLVARDEARGIVAAKVPEIPRPVLGDQGPGDGDLTVFAALVAYVAIVRNDVQQPALASARAQPAES